MCCNVYGEGGHTLLAFCAWGEIKAVALSEQRVKSPQAHKVSSVKKVPVVLAKT